MDDSKACGKHDHFLGNTCLAITNCEVDFLPLILLGPFICMFLGNEEEIVFPPIFTIIYLKPKLKTSTTNGFNNLFWPFLVSVQNKSFLFSLTKMQL